MSGTSTEEPTPGWGDGAGVGGDTGRMMVEGDVTLIVGVLATALSLPTCRMSLVDASEAEFGIAHS